MITCTRTRSRWAVPLRPSQRATMDKPAIFLHTLVLNLFRPNLQILPPFSSSSRSEHHRFRNVFFAGACRQVIANCTTRCSCLPGTFPNHGRQFSASRRRQQASRASEAQTHQVRTQSFSIRFVPSSPSCGCLTRYWTVRHPVRDPTPSPRLSIAAH